ncbi:MAG: PQQ-binding-like beta-propeller repeat protein [Chloroflexi bacterium]|nr:PQQ-binding-like beta-propeller repeat protein [Chloroflexota bacterium]
MKKSRNAITPPRFVVVLLIVLAIFLSACRNEAGDSWPGVAQDPDDAMVYVANDKSVVAVRAADDTVTVEWEYSDDEKFYAVPTIYNDMIFIGDYKGRMHAINRYDDEDEGIVAGTGEVIYEPEEVTIIGPLKENTEDRIIGGAAVNPDENLLYFGYGSRDVVAISLDPDADVNGEEWTFETDHGVWATPLYVPVYLPDTFETEISPAPDDSADDSETDGAEAGDDDENTADADQAGEEENEETTQADDEADVGNGESEESTDEADGASVDETADNEPPGDETLAEDVAETETDNPAVELAPRPNAMLYIVSLDQHFYAVDPADGELLWDEYLGGAMPSSPTHDPIRNWAYVGTFGSEMVALDLAEDADDRVVDRYETEDWVWGSPALVDGVLYCADISGYVYALTITDDGFEEKWKVRPTESSIRGAPLVVDGLVLVGSQDNTVYALSTEDGTEQWSETTEGDVLTELVLISVLGEDEESTSELVIAGTSESDERLVAYELIESNDGKISRSRAWAYSD